MGLLDKVEAAHVRSDRPDVNPGDTVEVSVRVVEGDKTRLQKFKGEVIGVRGSGTRKTFTARKISGGIGVERTFPLHGPSLGEIKIVKRAKVRRAKLFYLRSRSGKAARLSEKKTIPMVSPKAQAKAKATAKKAEKPAQNDAVETAAASDTAEEATTT